MSVGTGTGVIMVAVVDIALIDNSTVVHDPIMKLSDGKIAVNSVLNVMSGVVEA